MLWARKVMTATRANVFAINGDFHGRDFRGHDTRGPIYSHCHVRARALWVPPREL